jgi:hypothetical protein
MLIEELKPTYMKLKRPPQQTGSVLVATDSEDMVISDALGASSLRYEKFFFFFNYLQHLLTDTNSDRPEDRL